MKTEKSITLVRLRGADAPMDSPTARYVACGVSVLDRP
jgi:hypothetical protein